MITRTRNIVVASAVVGLLLASCGSDAKSTATTAAASAKDEAAAKLVPAAIASKGTLVVASDATYAPMEFVDTDGKTVIGADADLVKAIGQVLGLKVDIQNVGFDTIIAGLASGKYDIGASSFTDTKEREKTVDFVTYFSTGEGFYVAANNTTAFDGLESLCGHSVAVEKGTTELDDANKADKDCKAAGKSGVTVQSFDDQNTANLAVSSGKVEVGFVDSEIATYIAKTSNGQFKAVGKAFNNAPTGMAVPKNGIGPAVQAALKVLIANGTYAKILAQWGVSDNGITDPKINDAQF
jgi:polar amino acid transport system substrate-binding protein